MTLQSPEDSESRESRGLEQQYSVAATNALNLSSEFVELEEALVKKRLQLNQSLAEELIPSVRAMILESSSRLELSRLFLNEDRTEVIFDIARNLLNRAKSEEMTPDQINEFLVENLGFNLVLDSESILKWPALLTAIKDNDITIVTGLIYEMVKETATIVGTAVNQIKRDINVQDGEDFRTMLDINHGLMGHNMLNSHDRLAVFINDDYSLGSIARFVFGNGNLDAHYNLIKSKAEKEG